LDFCVGLTLLLLLLLLRFFWLFALLFLLLLWGRGDFVGDGRIHDDIVDVFDMLLLLLLLVIHVFFVAISRSLSASSPLQDEA
jgi:hypothetical protein